MGFSRKRLVKVQLDLAGVGGSTAAFRNENRMLFSRISSTVWAVWTFIKRNEKEQGLKSHAGRVRAQLGTRTWDGHSGHSQVLESLVPQ